MSTAHHRQLVVLDDQGAPVGVLFDVDALHALYGRDV
jgi:CBS-domain-containing membrane protein